MAKNTVLGMMAIFLLLSVVQASTLIIAQDGPPVLEPTGARFNEHDGVHQISGHVNDIFIFSIKYSDPGDDPPKKGYPRLLIDYTKDGDFMDRDDLNLTMDLGQFPPYDYSLGVDYSRNWVLDRPGVYSYAFFVINEDNETAFIGPFDGPVVLSEAEEGPQQEWWVEVGLWSMLLFVVALVFLVVGIGIGQSRRARGEEMDERGRSRPHGPLRDMRAKELRKQRKGHG